MNGMSDYASWQQTPPKCEHAEHSIRKKLAADGTLRYRSQCHRCGAGVGTWIAKSKIPFTPIADWDDDLADAWQEKINQHWQRHRQEIDQARASQGAEWRRRYEEHLRSSKWAALRERVMKRCNRVCEGCGLRQARHVHHLTYDRMGNEMLFDLVGICIECHEQVHGREFSRCPQ